MKTIKNIIAIVLAILVLGGAAAGIGRAVTGSWDIRDWGNTEQIPTDEDNKTPDTPTTSDTSGNLVLSDDENNGIALMSAVIPRAAYAVSGVSAQADTAYKITATVNPPETTHKECDWSVSWENANSEWAMGKTVTDYVTITPTADGALTANAVCLQPFGEPIIITVVNRATPSVYATVNCDYISRIESIYLETSFDSDLFDQFGVPYPEVITFATLTNGQIFETDNVSGEYTIMLNRTVGTIRPLCSYTVKCSMNENYEAGNNWCNFQYSHYDTKTNYVRWNFNSTNLSNIGVKDKNLFIQTFPSVGIYFHISVESEHDLFEAKVHVLPNIDVPATGINTDTSNVIF